METTAFNPVRQNYLKYDDKHYLLFVNEQQGTQKNEQTGETVNGYNYTGSQIDGSVMIEAEGVTDENRRAKFISGLLGTEYSIDDQIAIICNGNDTEQHATEMKNFEDTRAIVKKAVDEILARPI